MRSPPESMIPRDRDSIKSGGPIKRTAVPLHPRDLRSGPDLHPYAAGVSKGPINDLSRGCNADEVYKMAIITAALA